MDLTILIPGSLALLGAILGVLLTNYLARRGRQRDEGNARLDRAIESVAVALSAHHFAVHVGFDGAPESVTAEDIAALEQKLFMSTLSGYSSRFVTHEGTLRSSRQMV